MCIKLCCLKKYTLKTRTYAHIPFYCCGPACNSASQCKADVIQTRVLSRLLVLMPCKGLLHTAQGTGGILEAGNPTRSVPQRILTCFFLFLKNSHVSFSLFRTSPLFFEIACLNFCFANIAWLIDWFLCKTSNGHSAPGEKCALGLGF